jgi:hypothetical protein
LINLEWLQPGNGEHRGFGGPVAASVFGKAAYQWHPDVGGGTANPDGPPRQMTLQAGPDTVFTLTTASIIVLRGKVAL